MNKDMKHVAIAAIAYKIKELRDHVESWNVRDPYSREYIAILALLSEIEGINHIMHDEIVLNNKEEKENWI